MPDEQQPQARDEKKKAPSLDATNARRIDALAVRVEALSCALGVLAPDAGKLVAALVKVPRSGWPAVLEAYAIGQSRKNRGAGI